MVDPDYNQEIALSEVLDDLEKIQKKVGLLIKKIKKFIPSENSEEDGFDDIDLYVDPQKVIEKYGFPYLI